MGIRYYEESTAKWKHKFIRIKKQKSDDGFTDEVDKAAEELEEQYTLLHAAPPKK